MAKKAMGLGEFLGHKPSGGKGQYLRNWKKRDDHAINVVLHTQAGFVALWQHPLPHIQTWTSKQDGLEHRSAWSGNWNCIEPEHVLKEQYRRDKSTGERRSPPTKCPYCKLIEKVREMVSTGKLGFTQPLFRWEGDDPNEAVVLHAGGIYNAYGKKDLDEEQRALMKKAGIRPSEAWVENCHAKCNYAFVVVDFDNPGDGVQIAIETTLLGDKTKECIAAQMVSLGEDDGNPIKHPYVIRWIHQPDEDEFGKKYKAIAMPRLQLTSDIRRLVYEEQPPDIEAVAKPGNIAQLRAALEEHAVHDFGQQWWDDLFGEAEESEKADEGEGEQEEREEPKPEPAVKVKGGGASPDEEESEEVEGDEDDGFECDRCNGVMKAAEYTCPHCGAEYDQKTGHLLPAKSKEQRVEAKKERKPKRSAKDKGWPANPKDKIPF